MCKKTEIFLDISVNRKNGYEDSQIIREIISKHIILKQATIILKMFVKIRQLNNTQNGGISSFLLFHLVYYFYKE